MTITEAKTQESLLEAKNPTALREARLPTALIGNPVKKGPFLGAKATMLSGTPSGYGGSYLMANGWLPFDLLSYADIRADLPLYGRVDDSLTTPPHSAYAIVDAYNKPGAAYYSGATNPRTVYPTYELSVGDSSLCKPEGIEVVSKTDTVLSMDYGASRTLSSKIDVISKFNAAIAWYKDIPWVPDPAIGPWNKRPIADYNVAPWPYGEMRFDAAGFVDTTHVPFWSLDVEYGDGGYLDCGDTTGIAAGVIFASFAQLAAHCTWQVRIMPTGYMLTLTRATAEHLSAVPQYCAIVRIKWDAAGAGFAQIISETWLPKNIILGHEAGGLGIDFPTIPIVLDTLPNGNKMASMTIGVVMGMSVTTWAARAGITLL